MKSQEGAIHLLYLQVRPGLDHDEGVGEETCGELVQLWCHNADEGGATVHQKSCLQ